MPRSSARNDRELVRSMRTLARTAPRAEPLTIVLPKHATELSEGEALVAIADSRSVTLKRVQLPTRISKHSESLREEEAKLATRLADLQVACLELARAEMIPDPGQVAALTENEESLLKKGGVDLAAVPPGAIDPVSRMTAEFAKLVSDSYDTEEAARILGVNTSRVRQRVGRRQRTLFGFKVGDEWRVPKFQFGERRVIPGLDRVVAELPSDIHPVAVYRWFTTPTSDLASNDDAETPISPLNWLRMGNPPDAVTELASNL